ncbi:MAG TPA: hypothetical protein VIV15_07005 [Anaerolineales bacterium]
MRRSARAMGWCPVCGKLLYANRKIARKAAREHADRHMNEYPCGANPALWHIGGVPGAVIKGDVTRTEYYGSAS